MNTNDNEKAESFAEIALIIIAADNVTTLDERKMLFETVKNISVFQKMSETEFRNLLKEVNERMFSNQHGEQQLENICNKACAVLTSAEKKQAFDMANELANADGLDEREELLLTELERRLL